MITPTYEVSVTEPPHPDRDVVFRLHEYQLSTCDAGCKIYKDPRSNMTVLVHSSVYGCRK